MLENTGLDTALLAAIQSIDAHLQLIETHLEKISHWPEFEPPLYDDEPDARTPVNDNPGPDQIPGPVSGT